MASLPPKKELIEKFEAARLDLDDPIHFLRLLRQYPLELWLSVKEDLKLTQILFPKDNFSSSHFFIIVHQLTTPVSGLGGENLRYALGSVKIILSILEKPLPDSINQKDFKSIIEFIASEFPEILPYKNILILKNLLVLKDIKAAKEILASISSEEKYRALIIKDLPYFQYGDFTPTRAPVIELFNLVDLNESLDPELLRLLIQGLSNEQMTNVMQKFHFYSGLPILVMQLHFMAKNRKMLDNMQILLSATPIETVKQLLLSERSKGQQVGKGISELESKMALLNKSLK